MKGEELTAVCNLTVPLAYKKAPIHFVLSASPSFTVFGSQRKGSIDICWQMRFCFNPPTNVYVLAAEVFILV